MTQSALGAAVALGVRDVGGAVVGHQRLDRDSLRGEPAQGAFEEGERVAPPVREQRLRVGQPRVVVDGDMDVLPVGAPVAAHAVGADVLADLLEAAELLGVEVQQFAGTLAVAGLRITSADEQLHDRLVVQLELQRSAWVGAIHDQRRPVHPHAWLRLSLVMNNQAFKTRRCS